MELAQAAQAAAQAAPQVGAAGIVGTALTLGIRHGIDWDHIAAISDITSATSSDAAPSPVKTHLRALGLASLYAAGHALVVVVLGLAALYFQAILPDWIDPIMERVVGATLLALGFWVVYSLARYWRGGGEFRLRSRWMLVFAGVREVWRQVQARVHGHSHRGEFHVHRVDQYSPWAALGVGVIHGIGAETGTQVLIIAAVGGAASQGLGLWMLLAFVAGLLVSNTAIALATSTGFVGAGRASAIYVAAGCLAATLSLLVGSYFVLGMGDHLPDLQAVIGWLAGEMPA
jgi:high-affinity nickel-transport protein